MHLRLIVRGLQRTPGFTLASIATIALAMALSTTGFAIVDGVLFKALPYAASEQIYRLGGLPTSGSSGPLSPADVARLKAAMPGLAIGRFGPSAILRHPSSPNTRLVSHVIDPHFFEVLGSVPMIGGFAPEDFARWPGRGEAVPAIISHRLWRDYTGESPSALGTTLELVGRKVRVAGVLPPDFVFPHYAGDSQPALLFPLVDTPARAADRWARNATALVRIPDARSAEIVRQKFDAALAGSVGEYGPPPDPDERPYDRAALRKLDEVMGANERPAFRVAFAGGALLIVIACINVTSLVVARIRARARELRVCTALGASRRDIAALIAGEVLVVTLAGAAAGLLVTAPVLAAVHQMLPDDLLLLKAPRIDWRVAAFALAVPSAVMMLMSLFPLRATSYATAAAAGPSGATPRNRSWMASSLLAVESAIGIALVVTGTFVLTSFLGLRREPSGLTDENLVVVDLLPLRAGRTVEERASLQETVLNRLLAVSGVRGAATLGAPLLEDLYSGLPVDPPHGRRDAFVREVPVSSQFFEVAGLTLMQGRLLTSHEIGTGAPFAVITDTAARAYWPGGSAVGSTLTARGRPFTITGVVADVRMGSQGEGRWGEVFTPVSLSARSNTSYLVRADDDALAVASSVAAAIARDVPGVLVRRSQPVRNALAETASLHRFRATLFAVAGASALVLLAVGVAGIVAASVRGRWRETGIRAALGASRGRLVRLLVADHLRPAAAGVLIGLALSWWARSLLVAFLYQLDPDDSRIWAAASALILLTVTAAAWLPARLAAHADPAVVLRAD